MWCASGALSYVEYLNQAFNTPNLKAVAIRLNEASEVFHNGLDIRMIYVNDFKGHAATLAMFDRAIAKAEREENEESNSDPYTRATLRL